MKFKRTVIVFIILSIGAVDFCCAQNYYEQAYKQYYGGTDDKISVELFTKAIENNQEPAKSYMLRGAAKMFLNDFFGASMDMKQSIRLDSTDFKAYYYMGRLYFAQGFFDNAVKQYNRALLKKPDDADTYDSRAIAKIEQKNFEGGILDENTAIQLNPSNAEFYNTRGFAELKLERYEEAIKDFDKALKIAEVQKAYANKGVALAGLKRHMEAIDFYTKALDKMPAAQDVMYYRGISYKAIGKTEQACQDFSKSSGMGYQPATIEKNKTCP